MGRLILRQMLIAIFLVTTFSSAEVLKLSKKKNFYLGKGEYLTYNLTFPKYENYTFKTQTKGFFHFKNRGNGKIQVVFDASLGEQAIEKDKLFKQSFIFVHNNIGKKIKVSFSARYSPELFFRNSGTNKLEVELTPEKKQLDIVLSSLKNRNDQYILEKSDNKSLSLVSDQDFKFTKGDNILHLELLKEVDLNEKFILYRKKGEKKAGILNILVKSKGFAVKTPVQKTVNRETPIVSGENGSLDQKASEKLAVETGSAVKITKNVSTPVVNKQKVQSTNDLIYFIIIGVLTLVIVLLLIKTLLPKKTANSDKYELFYHDVATMLDVNLRGKSIDNSIDEMILLMLELTNSKTKEDGDFQTDDESDSLLDDENEGEKELLLEDDDNSLMSNLDFFEEKQKEIQDMGKSK